MVGITALLQVSGAITGFTSSVNTSGAITISTAKTQNLAPGVSLADGQLVTISGVNDSAINGRWLVTSVQAKTSTLPASFVLENLDQTPSNGDNTPISNTGLSAVPARRPARAVLRPHGG